MVRIEASTKIWTIVDSWGPYTPSSEEISSYWKTSGLSRFPEYQKVITSRFEVVVMKGETQNEFGVVMP